MINSQRPDILLIVLDTLRADRLSCYGYDKDTTPHLDAFAENAVLFERAISPGQWTIPSHGSIFTGEYPSTHGTTQIFDKHSVHYPTIAEQLHNTGYETVGFCNNPLLGVVENDLDRGFEDFFNYGGLVADRPQFTERRPHPLRRTGQTLVKWLNKLNGPIQELFTHNDLLLSLFMNPIFVRIWQRNINFKGNTRQSLVDFTRYIRTHRTKRDRRPLFAYMNLMETHLPFNPPKTMIRKFAPIYNNEPRAKQWMHAMNDNSYAWIAPITKPYSEMQHAVLNDMYDAEVAYEDYELRLLLDYLNRPAQRDDMMVIIMSDHGEGLDHHSYVGHSLVAYDDLMHVPAMIRYPKLYKGGTRVSHPVSTRRIFHSVLKAADPEQRGYAKVNMDEVLSLSLHYETDTAAKDDVFAEAIAPLTFVNVVESRDPETVKRFRCKSPRRALYLGQDKLITVDDIGEELYNIATDPSETENHRDTRPEHAEAMTAQLALLMKKAMARQFRDDDKGVVDLQDDEEVVERLRRLGYFE